LREILNVSDSFISKWWLVFESEGVLGILSYQGSKGYLNAGATSGNQLVAAEELLNLAHCNSTSDNSSSSNPTELL